MQITLFYVYWWANNVSMAKTLFEAFTEKLKEEMPNTRTMREAFDKANDRMGFQAYSCWQSYRVVQKRNKKTR